MQTILKTLTSLMVLAGLFVFVQPPATAHACSCIARFYSPEERLAESDMVFVGTVASISGTTELAVTFNVEGYWKGAVTKNQIIYTAADSAGCGYGFTTGTKYIVYADLYEGKYSTGLCGFTTPATNESVQAMGPAIHVITVESGASFRRNLSFGMRGEDVRMLQRYLNIKGFIVAMSGAGSFNNETMYFGPATRAALIRFQNEHKASLGISSGTGFFGPLTRALIQK
jgi:hypothetical protein